MWWPSRRGRAWPQVRRLFRTFSDGSDAEVAAPGAAADELGGVVTEHYQSVLHLLRKAAPP